MSSYLYSLFSPTDCTAWGFSHRLHGFTQNFLLSVFSHRFHRFTQKLGCLQGGALVSSASTEQLVHQPSNVDIHLTTLVHLRQVHPLKTASVKIREICGRLFSARSFCEFCGFRGRFYSARSAIRGKPFHARILTRNSKGR